MSNPVFDIVVCHGPNDDEVLNHNIKHNKKNIVGHRNFYVITHDKNLKRDDCIVIWEGIFPFKLSDIKNMITSSNNRYGWYLQQLLKLYISFIVPDVAEYYLTIDCDTMFLKETYFFSENKPIYTLGTEYHKPYFEWMNKLDNNLKKNHKFSGISHHMMYSKKILQEMIKNIENKHNEKFWKIYINFITPENYNLSGAAENELYFTYIVTYHANSFLTRFLRWTNTNRLLINSNYDFISWHWYLRN